MVFRSLICRISSLMVVLFLASAAMAQDAAAGGGGTADIGEGKTLFQNQCAACHNKNMKDKLTGPALGGMEERWAAYPREDLYSWIRNSQGLIAAGHPRATELWAEWKPNIMTNFPNLTDQQIENLIAYINDVYVNGATAKVAGGPTDGTTPVPTKPNNTPLFIALTIILAILAIVLGRIISSLNYILALREGDTTVRRKTLVETLTSKGVIAFVIFALVVLGGYTTVNNAISLGRQQNYQPEQPIKFSHATHAGLQKIDCEYCHDGARRSKHSNIPAANTCMNCHRAIKVGSQYGTGELTKIFASIGYDPSTDKYISNYDSLSTQQIERIYKKWIADTYVQENSKLDAIGEKTIEDQWKGIVAALTNKETGDQKIQGPIEWTRIHNMPDHVYFNHAQHVAVGQLECQTCHGKVEEMELVYQYSPLSMGWCINCHRQTEIQFTKNGYYDNYYEKYHKEIANGARDKVTVENIGGLECQKCHY